MEGKNNISILLASFYLCKHWWLFEIFVELQIIDFKINVYYFESFNLTSLQMNFVKLITSSRIVA